MDELVTVATFSFPPEAETIRLLLEQNGIESYLQNEYSSSLGFPYTSAGPGVKLQVSSKQFDAAKVLLDEYWESVRQRSLKKDEAGNIDFPCEECGMTISFPARRAGGVETCPYCKNYVDVPE